MFEALMPQLVLKEKELGKQALGLNNSRHVDIQIQYAKDQGYAAWGMSPAATPDNYSEFAATLLEWTVINQMARSLLMLHSWHWNTHRWKHLKHPCLETFRYVWQIRIQRFGQCANR